MEMTWCLESGDELECLACLACGMCVRECV